MFVTAFHEQQNNDLSKFSTGTYIYPDTDYNNLADPPSSPNRNYVLPHFIKESTSKAAAPLAWQRLTPKILT